jgi:hypothetical protein
VLDVNYVFGKRNLEKDPLMETFDVDCPPDSNNNPLIDPSRFEHAPERDLGPEDEYKVRPSAQSPSKSRAAPSWLRVAE